MSIPTVTHLTANRDVGRTAYRNVFLHATRGPGDRTLEAEYRAAVSYMLKPGVEASAQFCVGPAEVTRLVLDTDSAWHAQENNRTALSIEIAQPESQPAFSDFQYRAVAEICRNWCDLYGIPKVRVMSQLLGGIIGHEDSEQGKRWGKSDPGPRWDWGRFMAMLTADTAQDWDTAINVVNGFSGELAGGVMPTGRQQEASRQLADVVGILERLRPKA